MAETGNRNDPFPAFRFRIDIDGMSGGFSECTGIEVQTEVFEYAEGGVNDYVHKLPSRFKHGNVTFKRGIVDAAFWNWHKQTLPGDVLLKTASITQLDEQGQVVQTWRLDRAYPCKVQGPTLNGGQSSVSVETMELCHHGLKVV
ncbi:MAG: phage tail protein [Acidobacteriota bacterium]